MSRRTDARGGGQATGVGEEAIEVTGGADDEALPFALDLLAHELRAPLTVVRSFLALLDDGSFGVLDASARALLPSVITRVDTMNRLVTGMLESARLDGDQVRLARRPIDLREAAQGAVAAIAPRAAQLDHEIVLAMPGEPVGVDADPVRLETALTNLLDNACKYSPGEPRVECIVRRQAGMGVVDVVDHGVGLSEGARRQLFRRFSRVVTPATRSIAGTGLGLYLGRELVRAQGGDVTVTSSPGRGSTFSLTLPLADMGSRELTDRRVAPGNGRLLAFG